MPTMPSPGRKGLALAALIAPCLFALLFASCTIVPDKDENADKKDKIDIYFASDKFNADEFVEKAWDAKVVPFFEEKALPIGEVLAALAADPKTAGSKFGYREKAEGSPWNYRVKGEGKIVGVNTESRASTVDVDLDGDGVADMAIQIGPVIKDTGIRDSLDFISFTNFTNQLEFARLSNAFNKKVNEAVLASLNREGLMGKEVAFTGVFTQLQDPKAVRLTPVILEVK